MKDKFFDVPYCGVREDKIKSANPVVDEKIKGYLKEFIVDRYNVHLKKDVQKLPAPWTDNPIFQQVKFTNVRREHDRQSRFYIEHIAEANCDWNTKFWNTVMFRMFNLSTIWEHLSGGDVISLIDLESKDYQDMFRADLKQLEKEGHKLFTNAFNTGGLKQSLDLPEFDVDTCREQRRGEIILKDVNGNDVNYKLERERLLSGEIVCEDFEPYMPMRIIRYIARASKYLFPEMSDDILIVNSQEDAYQILMCIRGFSRFLAYQVFVDLTYCEEFPFSENHFTVSGPGCDAGLNLLFKDRDGMTYEECLFWLVENQDEFFGIDFKKLFSDLPEYDRRANVMMLEDNACELQKYVRCKEAIAQGKKPRGKVSADKLMIPPRSITKTTKKLW